LAVRRRLKHFAWLPLGTVLRTLATATSAAASAHLLVASDWPLVAQTILGGTITLAAFLAFAWPFGTLPILAELLTALTGAVGGGVERSRCRSRPTAP
jgi:hypothetical protein